MNASRFWVAAAFCVLAGSAHAQPQGQGQAPALESLHAALNLTPAQQDDWGDFQQAYAVDPDGMAKHRDAFSAMPKLTAPRRVDLSVSMAKEDLAGLERRAAALKKFYATLSPQQQSVFDRETLPPPPDQN